MPRAKGAPKDPARVAAGKKAWANLSPAKKAAVRARLKRVRPNKGGGGTKSKATGKALTASNPGKAATTTNKNHAPRGGSTYQAVKVTAQAAMPLTDYALTKGPKSVNGLMAHLKARAKPALGYGYAVAAVDFAASKHRFVRHANALSRLSVTGVLPEGYLALKAFEDARGGSSARSVHTNAAVATTGYNPAAGTWRPLQQPRFRMYHKLKWGGALARLIANRTRIGRSITRPIRENVLRELGGSV